MHRHKQDHHVKRSAFFVSDRTGITVEMLGHSLLTQFDAVSFDEHTMPFVDTVEKANDVVARINRAAHEGATRPLIFSTLVNPEVSAIVATANGLHLDLFDVFIAPMEEELGVRSTHTVGRSHSVTDMMNYHRRIEAINYSLSHDDGLSVRDLSTADIILIGVSRSGKTPTCLYLALQFGIRTANYPLLPEDFGANALPVPLKHVRSRLFGLTITPDRLQRIRSERKPGSSYASSASCQREVREAEALMRQEGIPYLDVSTKSIEEIATTILHRANLVRHLY
jgi:regulator of PEP synthase PpsR (kinase-PPPase family)